MIWWRSIPLIGLVPGAPGEAGIAALLRSGWRRPGWKSLSEVLPGRPNVVGIAHSTGGGRTLLLNGMDTVAWPMANPFTSRIADGRLFGRSARTT